MPYGLSLFFFLVVKSVPVGRLCRALKSLLVLSIVFFSVCVYDISFRVIMFIYFCTLYVCFVL